MAMSFLARTSRTLVPSCRARISTPLTPRLGQKRCSLVAQGPSSPLVLCGRDVTSAACFEGGSRAPLFPLASVAAAGFAVLAVSCASPGSALSCQPYDDVEGQQPVVEARQHGEDDDHPWANARHRRDANWLDLLKLGAPLCPNKDGEELGSSAKQQYTVWVLRYIEWARVNDDTFTWHSATLTTPPGTVLPGEDAARANATLPSHLVQLPQPDLELLPKFLRWCFIPDADRPFKKSEARWQAGGEKFSSYKMARAAVLKLWELKRKLAEVHMGYRDGVPHEDAVGSVLDHNGFTQCPKAESRSVIGACAAVLSDLKRLRQSESENRGTDVHKPRPDGIAKEYAEFMERYGVQQLEVQRQTIQKLDCILNSIAELETVCGSLLLKRQQNADIERRWERRGAEFARLGAAQELGELEQPTLLVPSVSPPHAPSTATAPTPQRKSDAAPVDEGTAVGKFLDCLVGGRALNQDVRGLWEAWNYGKLPTSVGAGASLPDGLSWRQLEVAFEGNGQSVVDARYRLWRGRPRPTYKPQDPEAIAKRRALPPSKRAGAGVDFMHKRKRFLRDLEAAIGDPQGCGETETIKRYQELIDREHNGSILEYATAVCSKHRGEA